MDEILKIATEAAEKAGQHLMSLFGKAEVRQKGSTQNLVTQADLESEKLICDLIEGAFPNHKLLLEEGQSTGVADDEHLWIIDPLDATNNFAHNIPHFSVSIAYASNGDVKVGVIIDPTRNELFHAVKGGGAFLNGQPIQVTESTRLEESIVGTGFYYDRGTMMKKTLDSIHTLFSRNIRGMRRMGSAAIDLSWVACGRFDAFFEYKLEPWDYSAGKLLIEEAGGKCSDRVGNPLQIDSQNVIVSNGKIHDLVVDAVKWSDS